MSGISSGYIWSGHCFLGSHLVCYSYGWVLRSAHATQTLWIWDPQHQLCHSAVAVDKGRNLESLPSHLSEDCGSRRAVTSWRIGVMLLQGTQMLFTSRASVPYICLIAEVVLTPSNRQTKYFILNGFRVAIFDRLNNRAFLDWNK